MIEPQKTGNLFNDRARFEQTPDRYTELTAKKSLRLMLASLAKEWKKSRTTLRYADIGCGSGDGTAKFRFFLQEVTGMPVKAVGADAAQECKTPCESRGIEFSCTDLNTETLPFEDCQIVTLFETIEHIFNTDFLLQSIRKAMSSDGVLLVTTLNVVCWKNRILVPLGIQPFNTEVSNNKLRYGYRINRLKNRMDTWKPAGHIRPFTIYSLCDLLEDNGFRVTGSYGLENWGSFKFLEKLSKNMCTGMLVFAKPK